MRELIIENHFVYSRLSDSMSAFSVVLKDII
jgi:hypothetical protein